ncbi:MULTISPECIES: CitMHS family transporter [Lacticaseibacillus]|jgi:CitMHS family citrate-Mg2+:H+ or citrate-Ca2+:H+ symporter|uniref:Citrate transporter n=8 Tax=Lacticaseibacillus TaxID=2759736 RepID=A0AAN1EZA0_LACCA|nr:MULTISPECIES: citrate:proton symporter [Lacticaseibacillus]OFS00500.1 citrate transporter [Lactobacillus sp. HMSC068F07]ARY91890.1 citrate transporter [Lacticaseibacillus casei]KAB1970937.1 citrate transporter [Lacticaseibacillus casei]KLI76744.1 citrate transporter [Lacticaseibacillus casei]KRK12211.1 citrate ABC transporter [Lacticaseibacillus zeae DSM 20178 = KCTC 3804]
MLLTVIAYAMIIVFMYVIMTKKLSPFTSLVMIPLLFAIIAMVAGVAKKGTIGDFVLKGLTTTANTGIMLLFAILYFSIMLDAGLFDPITARMIKIAKGDPMKVLMATAIVAMAVSLNGDGTTTTLICCSAFIPIYKKLNMNMMNLGVLIILQNTIMNLLPWGGPTARAMAVLKVDADILTYLLPGMILALAYVVFYVAPHMGRAERKRLGVRELTDEEIDEMTSVVDPEVSEIRRPNMFAFNGILTIVLIAWLVASSFIKAIAMPPLLLFLVGTCIALMANYPKLGDQSKRIGANGGDAVQVVILVFAAGVFMGLFQGTGMAEALAKSFTAIIPSSMAGFWGLVIALISAPGTFFLSNDGFYFGVMPVLATAGRAYGFTNMQMALASLMGQAFHLLSPLVAFIYLLLRLTGLDMGKWQREAGKYALGVFAIFVVTVMLFGHVPFYLPQK